MSVKRYQPVAQCVEPSYQAQMVEPKVMEFSEGEYVRWEDYDATCETLAHTETERDASDAEVERLKAEVERLEGLVKYWQIEAETDHALWVRHAETNERLRKAGDAMANWFRPVAGVESLPAHIVYDAWNAAKEGKQS